MKPQQYLSAVCLLAALAAFPNTAAALDAPDRCTLSDSRIQCTEYNRYDVVLVRAKVGRAVQVVLAPNERVLEMAAGNSEAIEMISRRNNIYLKPKMDSFGTNIIITSNRREYSIELKPVGRRQSPTYRLIFTYPEDEAKAKAERNEKLAIEASLQDIPSVYAKGINSNYTMQQGKNSDSFRPQAAYDDGTFTYIQFARGRDIPNVFRQLEDGKEAILNATVQEDYLIVEGVYKTMMLRANNAVIGLYNESYTGGAKGTGTGTASPDVEREIIKE